MTLGSVGGIQTPHSAPPVCSVLTSNLARHCWGRVSQCRGKVSSDTACTLPRGSSNFSESGMHAARTNVSGFMDSALGTWVFDLPSSLGRGGAWLLQRMPRSWQAHIGKSGLGGSISPHKTVRLPEVPVAPHTPCRPLSALLPAYCVRTWLSTSDHVRRRLWPIRACVEVAPRRNNFFRLK